MGETDRVSVQTYVPADQREVWRDEAEDMNMSQAEYVRSMVQAGRRSFSLDSGEQDPTSGEEVGSPGLTPGDNGLKDRVLQVLAETEVADWEELRSGVTDDIDDRLEDALEELQADDQIRYSGRRGGYVVVEDGR